MTEYHVEGDIAVISVNNPPVNALSTHVRIGIMTDIDRANNDSRVKAIVICGKGRTFPAGADIREFATAQKEKILSDKKGNVFHAPENSRKPVVAAVHGTCLGGGFEVAISSHYRVVHAKARFGFPEVSLGILPAGAGTQRFPRLAGIKATLDLMTTGRHITASEALKMGAVDKVVEGDVVKVAIQYAKSIADKPLAGRITSQMPIKDIDRADELVQAALATAKKKSKGFLAPMFVIKSVRAAVDFPFEEGLKKEAEYSKLLFSSGQAVAQQYAFFAERAAPKWDVPKLGSHKTVKPRPLQTGAVIGGGSMGTGIAMSMMNAGMPVVLIEQNQQFLDRAVEAVKQLYAGSVKLGRMTQDQAKKILSLLKPSLQYSDLANVDIVVEAVFESMKLKKEVFARLDQVCKPSATLASNTSTLNIDEIASATRRPEYVIGTHFFMPAYYMRLLENVHGEKTSAETIATAQYFGTKIGKLPVLVGNCHAFVGNRMFHQYGAEAAFMVEDGAYPEEIDQTLEDFGFPLGSLKVADLSGLDVGYKIRQEVQKHLGMKVDLEKRELAGQRYALLADLLPEKGRYGRKTGKGYYKYEKPGGKEATPDEDVRQMIDEHRAKYGIEPRRISTQEIIERCVYAAINEGFHIMEEGYAYKPEDIDTIWLNGYGFPRYYGGPMFYANMVGLKQVYERVQYYHDQFPNVHHWHPSALLKKLSDQNLPISQWSKAVQSHL